MGYEQLSLDISNMQTVLLEDKEADRPQTLPEKIEEAQRALRLAADMS